jgi:hypothetical protein
VKRGTAWIRRWVDARANERSVLGAVDALHRQRLRPAAAVRDVALEPDPERRPLVSVIVPCFNYGRFLDGAVASVIGQRRVNVEVIIVDDASTDDSAEVADAIAAREPAVQVLRNVTNQGHVRTFNNGYALATGEFIVRLDADDLLTPGSLARAVALFDAFPEVGLVYGHPRHFEEPDPPAARTGRPNWTIWHGRDWLAERCRAGVNCLTTPEAIVRASVMREIGPLSTRLRFAQDMEMWLRVSAVADVGRVNGVDQALHRDHPTSMSATAGSDTMTDLAERREVFQAVFDAVGSRVTGASELHTLARRRLAREALDHALHAVDRGIGDWAKLTRDLAAFAASTWPAWQSLPEARALRRRELLMRRFPAFRRAVVVPVVVRRLRDELAYLRWARQGV